MGAEPPSPRGLDFIYFLMDRAAGPIRENVAASPVTRHKTMVITISHALQITNWTKLTTLSNHIEALD